MTRSYCLVSSLAFALVAAAHLVRAVTGSPLLIGGWPAPLAASWVAAVGAGALAVWGFRAAARRDA